MINESDLDRWMQMDKEKVIVELKDKRKWQFISDVISEIEWWACFHPKRYSPKNLYSISDIRAKVVEMVYVLVEVVKNIRNVVCINSASTFID